ncbi:I78 family peptidase inhibitor [Pseudomonas capsici]|uniref:I78 family peptidase inhibitor n=1 Tax=Pseudomonas capsici TaxID=2810614 RepID=UPI0021F0FD54|nr:I78 family peptidase inhibitor [Pseudomonas capsici]MCV4275694.1 I78 family peptidase inhibitor [Pseudomonas capsici]
MEKINPLPRMCAFAATVFCLLLVLPAERSFASEQPVEPDPAPAKSIHGKMTVYGCYAARASALLGEEFTPENRREIERLARAPSSRITSSGGPRDLSYSPLRLNIEVNGQNRIEDIYCQ